MNTKLITLVITLVVSIIITGSVLVPVLTDAQKTLGDPITLTNESAQYMSLSEGDVDMSLANGVLTVNDAAYTFTGTDRIVFACDSLVVWYNGANAYGSYLSMDPGIRNIDAFTIDIVDGKMTASVTYNGLADPQTVSDRPIAFSFYLDPAGNYAMFTPADTQPYVKSIKDLYAFGAFYTGSNKTFYWYYDGVAGGYSEDYTYNMSATLSAATNTTDLYKASDIVFDIGGETFTPYTMIVSKEVTGHASSGANYSLIGAIPIMVIIALVLTAVGMIYIRKD